MTDPPAKATVIEAVAAFVDRVHELRPLWEEHVRYYEHQPLPHLFFGDVSTWAVETLPRASPELLARVAVAVEAMAASPDEDVENVVFVSFLEYFVLGDDKDRAALAVLRPHLGPAALASVEKLEAFRDAPLPGDPRQP